MLKPTTKFRSYVCLSDDVGAAPDEDPSADRRFAKPAPPRRPAQILATFVAARGADPGGQVLGLVVQQADHFRADGAAAEQGEADRGFDYAHPTSNASRSSSVSRRTITREAPSRTATTGGRGTWL